MTDDLSLALIASNIAMPVQSALSSALIEAAVARRFCIEFHPIVGSDDTLLAWRAKARFRDAQGERLSSCAVLAALHAHPPLLLATELQLKGLALAHAPATGELLLPLDADSYAAAGACNAANTANVANAFDRLFNAYPRAVVEICENQPVVDVARLHRLLNRLAASGISLSISRKTPASACLSEDLYDIDWLRVPCPTDLRDPHHVRALEAIAETARQNGCMAFVSNVHDVASLSVVRSIGFAGACGPLFESQALISPEARPQESLSHRSMLRVPQQYQGSNMRRVKGMS